MHFIGATLRALGFLTRLPLPNWCFKKENTVADDAAYFPIAGAIIGVIGGLLLFICHIIGLSALDSAFIATITLTVITGALHEDGLSDVADAFFTAKTADQRLKIMKDSHIGAFGTLALIFTIGLRVILLSDILIHHGILAGFVSIVIIESLSRTGMIWLWSRLPLARTDGTAAAAGQPNNQALQHALILGGGIFIILGVPIMGIGAVVLAIIMISIFTPLFSSYCRMKIGGYTGDTLGALQQCLVIILAFSFVVGT